MDFSWSYSLRFCSSPITSYASATRLNFSSAFLSPGLESGWFSRASLRYAFLMSAALADELTPKSP